jgi:WD40 repeat protein
MKRWTEFGCVLLLAAALAAQQAGVPALAEWAPDGRILIASNGLLARFDLDSSGETLVARGVRAFAFSPDGARLALGGPGRLELRSYPELEPLAGPKRPGTVDVTALAWSRDGETLAAGTAAGHVLLWDLADNELWADLNVTPASAAARLRFSADGGRLLTAFADGRAILWDLDRREEVRRYALPPPDSSGAASGQTIADLSADGRLLLATRLPEQGEPEMALLDEQGAVKWRRAGYAVEFTPEGNAVLALVPPFRIAALYQVADAAALRVFEPPEAVRTLHLVRLSPDGKLLVGVGEDHRGQVLVLWDFATAAVLKTRR